MQPEHKLTSALTDTHTDGCVDYHEKDERVGVWQCRVGAIYSITPGSWQEFPSPAAVL